MSLIHLILAEVHEYLPAPVQVNLNAMEDILDQMCQCIPAILLIVQILHRLVLV